MELGNTNSSDILRDWQHLYFKMLHLTEELQAGHWDTFLQYYKSYTHEFEAMKTKQIPSLSETERTLINDVINKIKNTNTVLIEQISLEMNHTGNQIRKLKTGSGSNCSYGS